MYLQNCRSSNDLSLFEGILSLNSLSASDLQHRETCLVLHRLSEELPVLQPKVPHIIGLPDLGDGAIVVLIGRCGDHMRRSNVDLGLPANEQCTAYQGQTNCVQYQRKE